MLFQNVGDVIALDQIPHQHMGYVCYKYPLPPETIKKLNQRIYRSKRIHFEKLDIGNLVKKQPKSGTESVDVATTSGQDSMLAATTTLVDASVVSAGVAPTAKKAKMKTIQKNVVTAGGTTATSTGNIVKKKLPRKSVAAGTKAKAFDKAAKAVKEDMS